MEPEDLGGEKEALWQRLVNVQCSKPPKVVTTTTVVLDEHGLEEEATQLRGWLVWQLYQVSDCFDSVIETYPITLFLTVLSELYQKGLISGHDLYHLPHSPYMMRHSSIHLLRCENWLDSLVNIQSSKSDHVCATTFDILKRFLLTVVGKETQAKETGETTLFPLVRTYVYACTISVICDFVGAHAAI